MSKLQTLEPVFRQKIEGLLAELDLRGIHCAVTSGRRTLAEQDRLYAQGRTAPGKVVTKAKGGQSPHNFGLAVDICPMKAGEEWWEAPDDLWQVIHILAEQGDMLDSGYDWKAFQDRPHLEDPLWKIVQAKWRAGEIDVA